MINQTSKEYFELIYREISKVFGLENIKYDIFEIVYNEYSTKEQKSEFGEYFTTRNYTDVLVEILFSDEKIFNSNQKLKILDPAVVTGGFLTSCYKVLQKKYKNSNTYSEEAINYLNKDCLYGADIKTENVNKSE